MLTLSLFAQVVPDPSALGDFAQALLAAVMGGQWAIVAALALTGVVFLVRKFAPRWTFFATNEGAFSLNLGTSFLLAMATALFSGTAVTGALLLKALEMSFLAAGGWAALTKFLFPLLLRIPFVANLFPPRASASVIEAKVTEAGLAAAVVAKSPTSDQIANGP